jgi:[NiFe] hydrogenase diaphorase moiety small subunit
MTTTVTPVGIVPPTSDTFLLDGVPVAFLPGDTILRAARRIGRYIPHLCWHPDFAPVGSCRVCTVKVNGRPGAACTLQASADAVVASDTDELNGHRRTLLQMLFVEGNHFCPACEKSGNCLLQATAYEMKMEGMNFDEFYPRRPIDASHTELLIDFNRCILCELCVRASETFDRKSVFAIAGHGIGAHLIVNSQTGLLADSAIEETDRAAGICPVGAILPKRRGFALPIGERRYDVDTVADARIQEAS